MKILYIHGFASSPNSKTVSLLKKEFPEFEWHTVEVNHKVEESINKIENYIESNNIDYLVGTSLGGFYTMYTKTNIPKIAINPSIRPDINLSKYIGYNEYMNKRDDNESSFILSENHLVDFSTYINENSYVVDNTKCILSEYDEILTVDENVMTGIFGKNIIKTNQMNHRISEEFIKKDFYFILHNLTDWAD